MTNQDSLSKLETRCCDTQCRISMSYLLTFQFFFSYVIKTNLVQVKTRAKLIILKT